MAVRPLDNPWVIASRPKTLLAGIAPVIVGSGLALFSDVFQPLPALAALAGAIFIQIGTNLANDVADFNRGADTSERIGPLRVTQSGLLSARQVVLGIWVSFGLASVMGIYLFSVAGWPVLAIGLASILAGVAYTGGPRPYGYFGLGDLMVFIFFGPVAVAGTYYVQALELSSFEILASIPIGALTTAILVINNLRDIKTDDAAGKITLAVRLGERWTRLEYLILVTSAYLIPVALLVGQQVSWPTLLVFLTLPMAAGLVRSVYRDQNEQLNPVLARTGQLVFFFAALFAVGINL